ncbi:MAG: bifunctional acetate--CoA ligase family protein/GNAT family N-acetyltransferase [Alphaproteobacteria bacterium]
MTIRNLDYLLKPKSVALIGASKTPGTVGAVVARNLFSAGFDGPVMPVNPKHRAIEGVLTYPDPASLPVPADLAVIATPPDTVPGLVRELAERGTRAVVVITAGFGEGADQHGRDLRRELLQAAKPCCLRLLGPNCLGLMVPGMRLNASFAHIHPRAGDIAFVAQSGAITAAVLDWAQARGVGFSHMITVGDMADVDFGDLLDYLALDPGTRAILLYIEAVTNARKFMSAARAAARSKPVVVVKAGRQAAGKKAAASHTGALAGSDAAYEAAFSRAGLLRVQTLDELFDAVETLALARRAPGDRLAVLTNGGGFGVLAADSVADCGGRLAELSASTMDKLDAVLPRTWSRGNPVDIIGDANGERYKNALLPLLEDPGIDAILVLNCPTAIASSTEAAQAVVDSLGKRTKTVLTSWIGGEAIEEGRRLFAAHRIPSYTTPGQAVHALMHMVNFRHNQELLMETPPSIPKSFTVDKAAAGAIVARACETGHEWLSEPESKSLLAAYGIPTVPTSIVDSSKAAAMRAAEIAAPVAVKILSPDITHKSDVGGVVLDLATPGAVKEAAEAMLARIKALKPEARIEGFSVQPMVHRPGAYELIVGVADDEQFGPLVMFGQGGTAVEVVGDRALGLPPLNMKLARDLMERTRIFKQLEGYRSRPPADLDAIALTMVKVSQLVIDTPEITEIDINPLLADEYGVMALDARIKVRRLTDTEKAAAQARFAIRPYPSEIETTVTLRDGAKLVLRPVRPEDEPAFHAAFAKLTSQDIRMRFFAQMKTLPHDLAARLTQIDYDREMAFVAFSGPAGAGKEEEGEVVGVVRVMSDPDNRRGEYAVIVRSDFQNRGLGHALMHHVISFAKQRGLAEIFGYVLEENAAMLKMCRELGFTVADMPADTGVAEVTLKLANATPDAAGEGAAGPPCHAAVSRP